jgi:hypothetical protein
MTESGVELVLEVNEADQATVTEACKLHGVTPRQARPAPAHRSDLIGPVVQYVLPGMASLGMGVRVVVHVIRALGVGAVVDDQDGRITVRKERDLPRGMLVVRRGENTLDVIDLADTGNPVDKIIDVLRRSDDRSRE